MEQSWRHGVPATPARSRIQRLATRSFTPVSRLAPPLFLAICVVGSTKMALNFAHPEQSRPVSIPSAWVAIEKVNRAQVEPSASQSGAEPVHG